MANSKSNKIKSQYIVNKLKAVNEEELVNGALLISQESEKKYEKI